MSVFRVALEGLDGYENQVVNVMHFVNTAAATALKSLDLAQAIDTAAATAYSNMAPIGLTVTTLRIRNLNDITDGIDYAVTWAGARTGEALPPQTVGVVQLVTAEFSRKGRGSVRLPAGTETDNTNGAPTAAWMTNAGLYIDALLSIDSGAISPAFELNVYSREDLTARKVISKNVRPLWGTLRSRKPGVGS